ncbi:MAG: amidohydrolase family protein, partial [Acidobacteriaceae bacterium]
CVEAEGLCLIGVKVMNEAKKRKIIDAHVHFYDHAQNRHEFLEIEDEMFRALIGDYSSLPRRYSFADYQADAPDLEIEGLVWTEFLSTDPVKEMLWAQRVADSLPVPVALVGLVDFLAPDLEERLDVYSQCSSMVGVREHLGWDKTNPSRRFAKRPDLLADVDWRRGLRVLTKYRFKCSLEVFAPQLAELLTVVQMNPDIQFAIAAMGWPLELDSSGFADWKRDLTTLGACPNAHIIVSAIECLFGMSWSVNQVQPWIDTLFEIFGTGRIMFGSHRPICKLSKTFPNSYGAYGVLTAGHSNSEQDAVFRGNAARWFLDPLVSLRKPL